MGSSGFIFRTEFVRVPEIADPNSNKRKRKLYKATVEGCWWKARSLLKNNEDAVIEEISENGSTMLHLAVEMGQNYFVKKLLKFLKDKSHETHLEKTDNNGRTALHVAAMVGNRYAAQILVEKSPKLLRILDSKAHSPLESAYNNKKLNTYAYLLQFAPQSSDFGHYPDAYHRNAVYLIVSAILTKQYGE